MQFEVNDGQYDWRLVGEDGVEPAVSTAELASAAREPADVVRAHTAMPEPGR